MRLPYSSNDVAAISRPIHRILANSPLNTGVLSQTPFGPHWTPGQLPYTDRSRQSTRGLA